MRKKFYIFIFIFLIFTASTKISYAAQNLRDLFWRRAWPEMELQYNSQKKKTLTDHSLMANAYRFQNKWPEVVRILESNSKNFPASVKLYADMTLLLAYENTNQTKKAITLSENLFKNAPSELKYYVALAQCRLYNSQNDSGNTSKALNRMLPNAGTDDRKIYTLTRLIKQSNNKNKIENALTLLELEPSNKEAAAILSGAKNIGNNIKTALGVHYYTIGNYQKALEYLNTATDRKAIYYKAWSNSKLKQNDNALNLWGGLAISGNPYASSSITRISNLAKDKTMREKCINVLERIVKERRGNIQSRALQSLLNLTAKTDIKRRDILESKMLRSFPNTNYSFNLLWARAWKNLDAGNASEAVKLLRHADAPGINVYKRSRILYWLGNSQVLAGQNKDAQKTFDLLTRKCPLTIYSLMISKPKIINGTNPDFTLKASELENWGFVNHAYMKLSRPNASTKELYRALILSRWLGLEETYTEAKRLENFMTSSKNLYRSDLEALYPRPYKNLVDAASKQYGVENNFVWAIMRQESAFKVNAKSWVGAAGLMQLMPGTAKDEAKRAGLPKYDLYNAGDNIKLGTSHLSWLGRNFNKKEYIMAAYNAGSGNARKWLKTMNQNSNIAQWIEAVKFDETNGYVQRVSANLEIYRMLYDAKK